MQFREHVRKLGVQYVTLGAACPITAPAQELRTPR